MPTTVTVAEIADMIGVDDAIIRRTLDRRDDDLQPYLHGNSEVIETKRKGDRCAGFRTANAAIGFRGAAAPDHETSF